MIANINHVKSVLGDLKAKKKFGQNFLIDTNTVEKIAKLACDSNIKTIEIGPNISNEELFSMIDKILSGEKEEETEKETQKTNIKEKNNEEYFKEIEKIEKKKQKIYKELDKLKEKDDILHGKKIKND